jgi:uncharacterized cupin superfamily protein
MFFKALASNTSGRLSLMDRTLPPGGRMPPPHRHSGNEEAYFVLVPAGAAHTFGNTSDAPARLLVIHSPALDGYFADLEQLWAGNQAPTPEQERALMSRHGMEPA